MMKAQVDISHGIQQDPQNAGKEGIDMQTGSEPLAISPENRTTSDALEQRFACADEKLSKLLLLFQEKIRDDLVKGQLFEKLYHDLTNYREDFVFKNITRRILTDVIRLFDRMDGALKTESLDRMQRDDLIDHVRSFRDELLRVLQRQEVFPIESKPGVFDEAFQEAIDTRLVSHPEEDLKVVEVVRRGFSYRGRLLRPEEVVVGRFSENKEGNEDG